MNILIIGFYGWKNTGDEAILGGLVRAIDLTFPDNTVTVASDIPFLFHGQYKDRRKFIDKDIEFRTLSNMNMNGFDLVIVGGGGLSIGYGASLILNAKYNNIPVIYLGGSINRDTLKNSVTKSYFSLFDHVSVRSSRLYKEMQEANIPCSLTFCPSVLVDTYEDRPCSPKYIVVIPRFYNDYRDEIQVNIIEKAILQIRDNFVIYVSSFTYEDLEGYPIDLTLSKQLQKRVRDCRILPFDGLDYQKTKWMIKNATAVINTGRYHGSVFSMMYSVPMIYNFDMTLKDNYLDDCYKNDDLLEEFDNEATKYSDDFQVIIWDEKKRQSVLNRSRNIITILEKYAR